MLSILVVGSFETEIATPGPDIEILRARDAEDAVEKLGRNRRIDAVLILAESPALSVVRAIEEENLAPPPLFVAASAGPGVSGLRLLPEDPSLAIKQLVAEIE
jgi:hypothetical protein